MQSLSKCKHCAKQFLANVKFSEWKKFLWDANISDIVKKTCQKIKIKRSFTNQQFPEGTQFLQLNAKALK